MSLFGGDSSAPPTESDYESENSAELSLSIAEPAGPASAQPAQELDQLATSGSEDDLYTDSEIEEPDPDRQSRPNRFPGKPQTWKGYTAADRQIAASLEQIRDSDLAAHLYNAHALKRRVRRSIEELEGLKNWQSRDTWSKAGEDLHYTDLSGLVQTNLVPPKDWTAWPLPPSSLPSANDRSDPHPGGVEAQAWVIGGAATQDVGEDLRQEMLAVFLRLAKEKWKYREEDPEGFHRRSGKSPSRNKSRSKSAPSKSASRSASRADTDMKESDADTGNSDEEKQVGMAGMKRLKGTQDEKYAESIFLADDAKSQRLLQPSINSILGNLDELMLAVRRTRLNHFGRGGSSDASSYSEFTSDAESMGPDSRSSSRATSRPPANKRPSARPSSSHASMIESKRRESRGVEAPTPDSDIPSSNASGSHAFDNADTARRARSSSTASEDSMSTTRDWSGRTGLMDWSEILALAAVKGWDEGAIARTAQRCAMLFGESMSFIPLHEHEAAKPVVEPVQYAPSIIPPPGALSSRVPSVTKRPFFQVGTLRCPHMDCYGHHKDFALPYRVIEHCIRVHNYDPRTNDSDNEERTVGGVHIDGFLQPVTLKPGWLGHGRSKAGTVSKKQKRAQEDDGNQLDAIVSIEDTSLLDP